MALTSKQQSWFDFALGQKLNPDLAYGLQCVDAVDHYAQFIFGVPWQQCVGAVPGGARQLFSVAPTAYWEKIANTPTGMPQKGDVLVFDGWVGQEFGHTGVLESATQSTGTMFQQDGFAAPLQYVDGGWYSNKPTHRATYTWPGLPGGFPGRLIGWLRPRAEKIIGAPQIKNTMDGIDVSSWQASLKNAAVPAEFVIVKSTGGVAYTNPSFKAQLADARADGALTGIYHFMRDMGPTSTAKQEADYFLKQTAGQWTNQTLCVLDFEHSSLISAGGVTMALQWCQQVEKALGRKPILYMNLSVANTLNWKPLHDAGYNRLWLAQYPTDTVQQGYGAKGTRGIPKNWLVVMWQYSQHGRLPGYSGDLDLNIFYGTPTVWQKYAANTAVTSGIGANEGDELSAAEVREIKDHINLGLRRTLDAIADVKSAVLAEIAKTPRAVQAYRGYAQDENGRNLPEKEDGSRDLDPMDAYAHTRYQTRIQRQEFELTKEVAAMVETALDKLDGVGQSVDGAALKAEIVAEVRAALNEGISGSEIRFVAKPQEEGQA